VTAVKSDWLRAAGPSLCTLSKPLADPAPLLSSRDAVLCWVIPTFGPKLWQLPAAAVVDAEGEAQCAVFGHALLLGKVCKGLRALQDFLVESPELLLRPEGLHRRRACDLVARLFGRGTEESAVSSLAQLRRRWKLEKHFLYDELAAWIKAHQKAELDRVWPTITKEFDFCATNNVTSNFCLPS